MRLYIADDNVEFAHFCAEVARREGWTVTVCGNGASLIDELRQESGPALLMVDIMMPVLDGIEVIDQLAQIDRELRVRFITGGPYSSALAARMMAEARDIAAGQFLTKPIHLEELRTILTMEATNLHSAAAS